MPSDPILAAAKAWQKRTAQAANAGLNPVAIQAVAKADLSRVGAGGTAMSAQEALAAVQSASTGKTSQTKTPSTSLTGIPGRMVADVGQIIQGLAIGAAHVVEHPARDAKGLATAAAGTGQELVASNAWKTAHGYEPTNFSPSGFAAAARNVAKTPLGRFEPGATTLAQSTTAGGRRQMLEHPGMVAGDLLPYGVEAVKTLAAFGKLGDVTETGSAAEAAAKGQVGKATLRAASQGLQKLTGGRLGLGVPTVRGLLEEYGLTRQASVAIGQLHDWAKNLSPTDKQLAFDLHVADHPTYTGLAEGAAWPSAEADAAHETAANAYHRTLADLQHQAGTTKATYEKIAKGTEVSAVDHPAEMTSTPATWHEVSAAIRTGQFELKLAAPEGWYLTAPGSDAEILVPKKGYAAPPVTIPPDPGQLARAHADSATAAQALAEHTTTGPPTPPQTAPAGLSPAQETFQRVFHSGGPAGPDRALLRALPAEQQQLIASAFRNQGKLLALGQWSQMGIVATATDIESHAMALDPILRDRYFASWTHFDPLDEMGLGHLKTNEAALKAVPALGAGSLGDLAHGYAMPKGVYQALFKTEGYLRGVLTSDRPTPGTLGKALAGGTRVFKGAIFLRPAMVANIAIRGLIQAVGAEGPGLFRPSTIADAWSMTRAGDATIASGFKRMTTDQAHSFLGGATLGRVLHSVPDAMSRATSFVSSMQRAAVFITEHDRLVAAGVDEQAARMAGMQTIRDTFVTHDAMTPVEQAVIRQIFPFYAHQKMLFNYVAAFPAEHPFVTEVLTKIGAQETVLNSSGVPQMIQAMFSIGNVDPATGNVTAVDVSGFNPFKSFANDFTGAGFTAALNPAFKLILGGLGVNAASGTPELYPSMTYDPATGGLVAKRPGVSVMNALETAIPQLTTLDQMLGFNNRLKALKVADPSAYRAHLFQTLGIPIPRTVNLPAQTAHAEESLFRTSSTAVSNYIKTGDYSLIAGYNQLPYQSRWWTPAQLETWRTAQASRIAAAKTEPTGTSLKALITPPPRTTAQLPPTTTP